MDATCRHALEWPGLWFGRPDTLSGASESRAGARRYERGPGSVPTGRPPRVVDADVGVLDRRAGRQDVSGGHGQRPSSDRRCREINAARLDGTQFVRRLPTQAESPRDPELRVSLDVPNGRAVGRTPRWQGNSADRTAIHNRSPFVQTHGSPRLRGGILDNPAMNRLEMPFGDGALAVAY